MDSLQKISEVSISTVTGTTAATTTTTISTTTVAAAITTTTTVYYISVSLATKFSFP